MNENECVKTLKKKLQIDIKKPARWFKLLMTKFILAKPIYVQFVFLRRA